MKKPLIILGIVVLIAGGCGLVKQKRQQQQAPEIVENSLLFGYEDYEIIDDDGLSASKRSIGKISKIMEDVNMDIISNHIWNNSKGIFFHSTLRDILPLSQTNYKYFIN